jgi:hypothetical protein
MSSRRAYPRKSASLRTPSARTCTPADQYEAFAKLLAVLTAYTRCVVATCHYRPGFVARCDGPLGGAFRNVGSLPRQRRAPDCKLDAGYGLRRIEAVGDQRLQQGQRGNLAIHGKFVPQSRRPVGTPSSQPIALSRVRSSRVSRPARTWRQPRMGTGRQTPFPEKNSRGSSVQGAIGGRRGPVLHALGPQTGAIFAETSHSLAENRLAGGEGVRLWGKILQETQSLNTVDVPYPQISPQTHIGFGRRTTDTRAPWFTQARCQITAGYPFLGAAAGSKCKRHRSPVPSPITSQPISLSGSSSL